MTPRRVVINFFAVAALVTSLSVLGKSTGELAKLEASRAQLNQIVRQLQKEQNLLNEFKKNEKSLIDAVDALDRQLEAGARQRDRVLTRIQNKQERLTELAQRVHTQEGELQRRKRQLGQHIRLAYTMGEQGVLKLALARDSVHQARQGLRYFGYLVRSRQQEFAAFRTILANLNLATAEQQAAVKELAGLMASLEAKQTVIAEERLARGEFLANVQKDAELKQRQVEELQKSREQMTDFISRLEEQLASVLPTQPFTGKILDNKGKLAPPTSLPAKGSDPGVLYQGPENTPVQAIFRGQVVYADWFRGYGLLVILDHGDHIFSLYGRNRKLLVTQGDWVDEQEEIAAMGDTGSADGPGLYFEIRAKGRADDPNKWLAKVGGGTTKTD